MEKFNKIVQKHIVFIFTLNDEVHILILLDNTYFCNLIALTSIMI